MAELYTSLSGFPFDSNHYITIGAFDGIHRGHRDIIRFISEAARSNGGQSLLITFDPHPQEVIQRGPASFQLLTTFSEKLQVLKGTGLDRILVIPFTRDFSELSAESFIETILVKTIGMKKVWIGYDHGFGRDRSGGLDLLKQYGLLYFFDVEHVPARQDGDLIISSTKIREFLLAGQVKAAAAMLGYPYSVNGLVQRGDGIGRTIGFPTANIHIENPRKLIPQPGVYVVDLVMGSQLFNGVCNIGYRPTFNGRELKIEVHLLNFNRDIYGTPVCVRFYDRLRDEQRFSSSDELVKQIRQDVQEAIRFWASSNP